MASNAFCSDGAPMYESTIAEHYAAYRPALHGTILDQALSARDGRQLGLDIGCGTGCSLRALAGRVSRVIGLDPSFAMLQQAGRDRTTRLVNGSGEQLPFADASFDMVTLAGSLNYIDRERLAPELDRICREDAEVVVYDFEVRLDEAVALFDLATPAAPVDYDHRLNLAGFPQLIERRATSAALALAASADEIGHLLLADPDLHRDLRARLGEERLFERVSRAVANQDSLSPLNVEYHYFVYRLAPRQGNRR